MSVGPVEQGARDECDGIADWRQIPGCRPAGSEEFSRPWLVDAAVAIFRTRQGFCPKNVDGLAAGTGQGSLPGQRLPAG